MRPIESSNPRGAKKILSTKHEEGGHSFFSNPKDDFEALDTFVGAPRAACTFMRWS